MGRARDEASGYLWHEPLWGAASGALATAAMTVAMLALRRALPRAEREPIPPMQVTGGLLRKARAPRSAEAQGPAEAPRAPIGLTAIGHLGYGVVNGALYASVRRRVPGRSGPLSGATFGAALWALGYAGWLPGLAILEPPQGKPRGWTAMNLASHLVYGAVLGALVERRDRQVRPGQVRPGRDGRVPRRATGPAVARPRAAAATPRPPAAGRGPAAAR